MIVRANLPQFEGHWLLAFGLCRFFCRGERLVRHVLDSAKWKVSYPRNRGLSHLRPRASAMKGPTRGPTAGSLVNSDGTASLFANGTAS